VATFIWLSSELNRKIAAFFDAHRNYVGASEIFTSEVAGLNKVIVKILMEIVKRKWKFGHCSTAYLKPLSSQVMFSSQQA
jgi:hypothetical protein